MKSAAVKLVIVAGILIAGLFAFCPYVMPAVNQAFAPALVHKPKPVLPPPGVKYLEKVEDLVIELTNRARLARGVAPLNKDAELREVARAYSDDMLVRRFFDHTNPDGVSFDERISNHYPHFVYLIGENIWWASGFSASNPQKLAKEIVDDWMSSPGHRENLLSPSFTQLGVGVSARGGSIRATQEFVGKYNDLGVGDLIRPWLAKLNRL